MIKESPLARADVYPRLKLSSPLSIVSDLCAALVEEREALDALILSGTFEETDTIRGRLFAREHLARCEARFARIITDFNKQNSSLED